MIATISNSLFLLSLFTLCSLNPLQNATEIVEKPKKRLYNPLVCYVETEGQLYGVDYHESQRHEPCEPDVKYCQKITAHFIAAGGEITKITMKGCDTVSLLPHFAGLECKGSGCAERSEGDEIYNVCCCNTETCNSNFKLSIFLPFIFLISRFIFY
ncbi:Activin_recp domain-containing protein [Caenorhabditis elegans]|uniref:Activin_recp domain-containing protein n=1 Tax=Caenorhabditis elegans TaxID=6239 RepID=Q6A597_CAEEL|nr:Activin_recp domain-containing protein [Caenorhabditis elegans]CCD70375.1 Activin_recp domain-containing protein [Caenorhabditis elegans]|eukprot:NP_001024055.1 Uncharacterized protein CELE_K12B6.9 [Caenorhabditis elegans]